MLKPYPLIRAKLAEINMTYDEFSREIGVSKTTIALRMSGKRPWSANEQYKVLDLFGIPDACLHDYFPRNTSLTRINNATKR